MNVKLSLQVNLVFSWFVSSLVKDLILLTDVLWGRRHTFRFVTSKPSRGTFLQSTIIFSQILPVSDVPPELPVFRPTHRESSSVFLVKIFNFYASLLLDLAHDGPLPLILTCESPLRPLTRCRWLFSGSPLQAWRCFCCFSPRAGWSSSTGCPGSRWCWTHTCWSGGKSWCCSGCCSPGSPLGAPDFRKIVY